MPASEGSPSTVAELEGRLRAVAPDAFLVSERILRRVIKGDRNPAGLGLQVPHRTSYSVNRSSLLALVDADELGVEPGRELPERVILLRRPDAELADNGLATSLVQCWRMLFHARIHLGLEERLTEGKLTPTIMRQRIAALGETEFEEAREVLRQEKLLLPPGDDSVVYVEFAAVYLELRHFAPHLVPRYFPALDDLERVDALLAEDIDAAELLARTRPEDAPDPALLASIGSTSAAENQENEGNAPLLVEAQRYAHKFAGRPGALLARADRADHRGNVVRAALLRTQAAVLSPANQAGEVIGGACADIETLVTRLQAALALPDDEASSWRELLPALLARGARRFWTVEARLLYDLQKVCVDQEREIYAVDLVEWGLSLGRRPVQRPLPGHREVLIVKHLRNAARLLVAARLAEADRRRLSQLLWSAIRRAEAGLRGYFRPLVERAFDDVGLVPQNLPESVARAKLVEELLDQVTERGFLTMSDLRDALSRNQLKLPDLAGPGEFLFGDKLILLNRRLAVSLDGVYQRGEIYRRWLQRLSSVAFGTHPGRFLTRYLVLPFGGAYVALEGLGHLAGLVNRHVFGSPHHHVHLAHVWSVCLVGFFVLGLLYAPAFRRAVAQGLSATGRAIRFMLIDGPAWLASRPPLRWLLESLPMKLLRRILLKPLIAGAVIAGIEGLCGVERRTALLLGGQAFVFALVFFNSRIGRNLDEAFTDWLVRWWQRFSGDLVPGLFRLIIDVFKQFLDLAERLIYTVDEWFRFKSGQGRLLFAVKAGLGLVWFVVTYVIRFCLNLLIEPQINPIKHFPVVTVSHKLLLPFIPALAQLLTLTLERPVAITVATIVITSIPGIFGFLVWELKENWRLYQANRSAVLGPVIVGSHGETVVRLLKPGFHSGTIPKLFARLRRAERKRRRRAARRHLHHLDHVRESLRHFVDRDLLELLRRCPAWSQACSLHVREVRLATNRIGIDITATSSPKDGEGEGEPLTICLDEQSGWLLGRSNWPVWLSTLSERHRHTLADAMAGFYKFAGVEAVAQSAPADVNGALVKDMRALSADGVVFRDIPIPWNEWVEIWNMAVTRQASR
jgi:hypothetical protein